MVSTKYYSRLIKNEVCNINISDRAIYNKFSIINGNLNLPCNALGIEIIKNITCIKIIQSLHSDNTYLDNSSLSLTKEDDLYHILLINDIFQTEEVLVSTNNEITSIFILKNNSLIDICWVSANIYYFHNYSYSDIYTTIESHFNIYCINTIIHGRLKEEHLTLFNSLILNKITLEKNINNKFTEQSTIPLYFYNTEAFNKILEYNITLDDYIYMLKNKIVNGMVSNMLDFSDYSTTTSLLTCKDINIISDSYDKYFSKNNSIDVQLINNVDFQEYLDLLNYRNILESHEEWSTINYLSNLIEEVFKIISSFYENNPDKAIVLQKKHKRDSIIPLTFRKIYNPIVSSDGVCFLVPKIHGDFECLSGTILLDISSFISEFKLVSGEDILYEHNDDSLSILYKIATLKTIVI